MRKKLRRVAGWGTLLAGFVMTRVVFAQVGAVGTPITLPNPLAANSFTQVVANVTSFLLNAIAIPLTAIMVLIGGFQMITSAGNPEKFASGRKTLTYAAIGFVVVLLASSVTYIIKSIFQS